MTTPRAVLPGEIVLEDAWRAFAIGDRRRTLKELLTGRSGVSGDTVQALAGVDLRVRPGETLGIIGRNGAGKTSTLRVLAGIVPLQSGRAECGGRVATLIELGAGFGREFTGRENILLSGALSGMSRHEIEEREPDIVDFSELGHFIDVPVKTYSSGMLVRLGFAIAAHLDADVLLIDEVLAVGDEAFQRKCLRRISDRIASGATLALVSHAPAAIERTCERVIVLDAGRVVFDGPTPEALLEYHQRLGTDSGEGLTHRVPDAHRKVYVEDVVLRDSEGRQRAVFSPGEALRIELGLAVRAGAQPCRVALELRGPSGAAVFGAGEHLELDGPARLSFDIPRLNLLGGDYDLVVAIQGPDVPTPSIDRLVSLCVADTPDFDGVADLRGTWTLQTAVRS